MLVRGRLQVRPYEKDGQSRLAVEVEASSVGHDLARGVANFQRARRQPGETALGRAGLAGDAGLPGGAGPADGTGPGDGNGLSGAAPSGTAAGAAGNGGFFAEDAVAALAAREAAGPDAGDPGPDAGTPGPDGPRTRSRTAPDGPDGAAEPAALSAPF